MSSGRTVSVSVPSTGPVSRPSSSTKVVAPVTSSPAISARCTGAAPRQAGSSEKCRLTQPCGGHVERGARHEGAVGDDRAAVGGELGEPREEVGVARGRRGQHLDAVLERHLLDRRGREACGRARPGRRGG